MTPIKLIIRVQQSIIRVQQSIIISIKQSIKMCCNWSKFDGQNCFVLDHCFMQAFEILIQFNQILYPKTLLIIT